MSNRDKIWRYGRHTSSSLSHDVAVPGHWHSRFHSSQYLFRNPLNNVAVSSEMFQARVCPQLINWFISLVNVINKIEIKAKINLTSVVESPQMLWICMSRPADASISPDMFSMPRCPKRSRNSGLRISYCNEKHEGLTYVIKIKSPGYMKMNSHFNCIPKSFKGLLLGGYHIEVRVYEAEKIWSVHNHNEMWTKMLTHSCTSVTG